MWWLRMRTTSYYFDMNEQKIQGLLRKTHRAATGLRAAGEGQIRRALLQLAAALEADSGALLRANARDLARQEPGNPRNDRLMLNEQRVKAIARSIRKISRLA